MAPTYEYAEWLTVDLLERVFGEMLAKRSVDLRDIEKLDDAASARITTESRSEWISVTHKGQFHGLIERRLALEKLARGALTD
jgi:hypothetical protein